MNKGLGGFLLGLLAIVGGTVFIALLIKKKMTKKQEIDFDEFDDVIDESDEYDDFFNDDEDDVSIVDEEVVDDAGIIEESTEQE